MTTRTTARESSAFELAMRANSEREAAASALAEARAHPFDRAGIRTAQARYDMARARALAALDAMCSPRAA